MSNEVRQHVFEPFFTTKKEGEGTGLGLSMIYGIVKQNKGYIAIDSEPRKGARVSIYFVKHSGAENDGAAEDAAEKQLSFAGKTVLLVEDDDSVRNLTFKILQSAGFQVLEAVNGAQAVRTVMESKKRIDLLLTDVVLPEMSGKEVAEKILAIDLDIKILFTSGYPEKHISVFGELGRKINFINKPFTRKNLLEKIKEVFDKTN
jgi:two-component system sensor histidine kinase EvgS